VIIDSTLVLGQTSQGLPAADFKFSAQIMKKRSMYTDFLTVEITGLVEKNTRLFLVLQYELWRPGNLGSALLQKS